MTNSIICPNCKSQIDVNAVLYQQIQQSLTSQFEQEKLKIQEAAQVREAELQRKEEQLKQVQKTMVDKVNEDVAKQVNELRSKLNSDIKKQLHEENEFRIKQMQDEIVQKNEQVKELHKLQADVLKLEREKSQLADQIRLELEIKNNVELEKFKEQFLKLEQEKNSTELQKRDKVIDDLNKRLGDAQMRIEQGSNKLTGEIKEIELRDSLKRLFPIDEIGDVASGKRGADVMQEVKNQLNKVCGIILYERKETINFDEKWIDKLKEDGQRIKANELILVTKTMPKDNEYCHLRSGVWVCLPSEVEQLVTLLRHGILKEYQAKATHEDKGTKMDLMYNYLVSSDFRNHIQMIVESFQTMDRSLNKEKEDAIKKFAEREGQIWKAKQSLLHFYGRVEGIANEELTREVKQLIEIKSLD